MSQDSGLPVLLVSGPICLNEVAQMRPPPPPPLQFGTHTGEREAGPSQTMEFGDKPHVHSFDSIGLLECMQVIRCLRHTCRQTCGWFYVIRHLLRRMVSFHSQRQWRGCVPPHTSHVRVWVGVGEYCNMFERVVLLASCSFNANHVGKVRIYVDVGGSTVEMSTM